jgi:hypothetical protein
VLVETAHVAAEEPAIVESYPRLLRVIEIPAHDHISVHGDVSDHPGWELASVVIENPHVHTHDRLAHGGQQVLLAGQGAAVVRRTQARLHI